MRRCKTWHLLDTYRDIWKAKRCRRTARYRWVGLTACYYSIAHGWAMGSLLQRRTAGNTLLLALQSAASSSIKYGGRQVEIDITWCRYTKATVAYVVLKWTASYVVPMGFLWERNMPVERLLQHNSRIFYLSRRHNTLEHAHTISHPPCRFEHAQSLQPRLISLHIWQVIQLLWGGIREHG